MTRTTKLEIAIIALIIVSIGIYLAPNIFGDREKMRNAQVSANAAVFTSKALSYFNSNQKAKASDVAQMSLKELNKLSKNPYNRKLDAYVTKDPQAGSILVTSDDKIQTITLTGLNREKQIIVRTLIKPPSFVTYEREENGK